MPEFVTVARVGDIPEGRGKAFAVGDRLLAVFHYQGQYFALDDFFAHTWRTVGNGLAPRGPSDLQSPSMGLPALRRSEPRRSHAASRNLRGPHRRP